MKYLLPLLFLPLFAQSQTITFHEGAGLNPRHIESLGPDSGWVELWVGQMAMEGVILSVWFDKWREIDLVELTYNKETFLFGRHTGNSVLVSSKKIEAGYWVRFYYKIKYKKA